MFTMLTASTQGKLVLGYFKVAEGIKPGCLNSSF